jgi:ATP-binding cassette subfamily B protein
MPQPSAALRATDQGLVRLAHDPEAEHQRPFDFGTIRRLSGFTRPHARKRNQLLALVVLRAAQFPAIGWSTAALISGPIAAHDVPGTLLGLLGFFALVASTALVFHFRVKLALELGEAVIHDLRAAIVERLMALPMGFYAGQRVGRLISRFTSDLEAVRIGVKDVAFVGTVQLGSMIIAGILMACYDWLLFSVVATLVPVLSLVISYFRKRMLRAYRAMQESFSRVTAAVSESIAGIRVTHAFARGAVNAALFDQQIYDHADCNMVAARRTAVFLPLLELNGQLFLALLLVIGGYRALHREIDFDVLVQFYFLSNFFFNPIAVLGNQYTQALTALAGAERVFALLDIRPAWQDEEHAVALPRITGRVAFRDVSFEYEPGRPVLHEIALEVEAGQSVALVGHSGSGKSTLLALLAKLHLPTSGEITIDGIDTRLVTEASLRRQMSTVSQDNFLFSGTVIDNIRLARARASDAEIVQAARALDVLDVIESFPRGWETKLGERGNGLSLGQRQIVCFTRAMLADPRVLLLDEATSALDAHTEQRLQIALGRLLANRTSFVVAHRLSTIRHADQVLVLNAGRIVERGTHASLLGSRGAYERLYRQYMLG